jgi:hypothetical protein
MTHANELWTVYESPLGALTLLAADNGITGLYFPGNAPAGSPAAVRPRARRACLAGRAGKRRDRSSRS